MEFTDPSRLPSLNRVRVVGRFSSSEPEARGGLSADRIPGRPSLRRRRECFGERRGNPLVNLCFKLNSEEEQ